MREIKFRAKWLGKWFYFRPGLLKFYDSNTLGEYTGLLDRNGREIYEGDIVAYWQSDGKSKYRLSKRLTVQWQDRPHYCGWNISMGRLEMNWEVIGNRYDNPELLK